MSSWILQLIAGGFLCALALVQALAAIRTTNRRVPVFICLLALTAAGYAFDFGFETNAKNRDGLLEIGRWQGSLEIAFYIFLIWFAYHFADLKRLWVPLVLTGLWTVALVQPSAWLLVTVATAFISLLYYIGTGIYLWRSGSTIKARTLSLCVLTFSVLILQTVLSNRLSAPLPYFFPLVAIGFITFLSLPLITDAGREAQLSDTVEANELRWRTLLQNVHRLVIGCKPDGTIESVNPFFTQVSGYSPEEVLGRNFSILCREADHGKKFQMFTLTLNGSAAENCRVILITKNGEVRSIVWSSVLLRDDNGSVSTVLSVGSDITDFENADSERDLAIRSLDHLKTRLETENEYLKEEISVTNHSHDIIGQSAGIRYVLHKIQQVAKTDATVLIEGETGVGKELAARAVHKESLRSTHPFIQVNCAALAPTLAESDLFGHEKGAFTGADRLRKGRFELADGGTLFLDEIGQLPLDLQSKLLRVLQEGEYERVGDSTTRKTDVRIIASTNRNLKAEVAAGRFREDLFYRLQIYPITVPSLRDRRGDIPALVQHFTAQFSQRHGKHFDELSPALVNALSQKDWPGNVRELANVIERAVILSHGATLLLTNDPCEPIASEDGSGAMQPLAEMEREYILRVLKHTGWKIGGRGGAAELLGLHPNTLRSRLDKLGIPRQSPSDGKALMARV